MSYRAGWLFSKAMSAGAMLCLLTMSTLALRL
eukprot:CAMPEP_0175177718 /NCGR_PEP_ID=MMETSP0087-20121206/34548_1 /TAXON_ID=136419 /ORGANISM="Unknown Unknown, Strain D1" /LENGTH=31 /DNA_ID= /DNA_START= /DNA_END= /DNA_ORIENTATION=